MKLQRTTLFITAMALMLMFALTACGSSEKNETTGNDQQTEDNSVTENNEESSGETVDVDAGVKAMLDVTNQMKTAIDEEDADKVKELGPKLEESWSSFEDQVKEQSPDAYEEVEKYLDPEIAGSKVDPLDKETMSKLNDQLISALNSIK